MRSTRNKPTLFGEQVGQGTKQRALRNPGSPSGRMFCVSKTLANLSSVCCAERSCCWPRTAAALRRRLSRTPIGAETEYAALKARLFFLLAAHTHGDEANQGHKRHHLRLGMIREAGGITRLRLQLDHEQGKWLWRGVFLLHDPLSDRVTSQGQAANP